MNIKLCRDEKGNDMSLAETRWKPGMLTVTTTVKRKKTIEFKFSGSLTMEEVTSLRDGLTAWLEAHAAKDLQEVEK